MNVELGRKITYFLENVWLQFLLRINKGEFRRRDARCRRPSTDF